MRRSNNQDIPVVQAVPVLSHVEVEAVPYSDDSTTRRQEVSSTENDLPVQELPSDLTYKDLERDVSSVLGRRNVERQRAAQIQQQNGRDLPSNLEYKDQGRDVTSFFRMPRYSDEIRNDTFTMVDTPNNDNNSNLPNAMNTPGGLSSHSWTTRDDAPSHPKSIHCSSRGLVFGSITAICIVAGVTGAIMATRGGGGGGGGKEKELSTLQPSTLRPLATNSPTTLHPSTTPPPTMSPSTRPPAEPDDRNCFQDRNELVQAVDGYFGSYRNVVIRAYGEIQDWCVSSVSDFSRIFLDRETVNEPLNKWDMSKAVTTNFMFYNARAFNQPLDLWDVSRVTDMSDMFGNAVSFNQDINTWNTMSVVTMGSDSDGGMFQNANSFNGDISSWNVSSVQHMGFLFAYASSFNRDLSQWDVSNVKNMIGLFWGAEKFNQTIEKWDVSSVESMAFMFSDATWFNGDISNWRVSSLLSMDYMFQRAVSFARNLCSWGFWLPKSLYVEYAFDASKCPVTFDPNMTATPPGPFCFTCM